MKNNKFLKTIKRIFCILICIVIIFLTSSAAYNKIMCLKEDKILNNIGTSIDVNGTNLRADVTGSGGKTIVLLSGLGTPAPITDFKPLADKLSKNYKVVTLEYAGYGLSDDNSMPRTNDVIVEEIRTALKKLNVKPPYILMPHSISGIYCMKYMNKYPNEVEAMIGIDSSVPGQIKYEKPEKISSTICYLAEFMDITGLTRLSYSSDNGLVKYIGHKVLQLQKKVIIL